MERTAGGTADGDGSGADAGIPCEGKGMALCGWGRIFVIDGIYKATNRKRTMGTRVALDSRIEDIFSAVSWSVHRFGLS